MISGSILSPIRTGAIRKLALTEDNQIMCRPLNLATINKIVLTKQFILTGDIIVNNIVDEVAELLIDKNVTYAVLTRIESDTLIFSLAETISIGRFEGNLKYFVLKYKEYMTEAEIRRCSKFRELKECEGDDYQINFKRFITDEED